MLITTDRLTLREFVADDWLAVLAYQSNPHYLRYYAWTERTPTAVQEFIGWFLADQQAKPRLCRQLAVTLTGTGELIGNCGIRLKSADAIVGDIGYELAPAHWGHGYATEAARAIVDYGFTTLKLHRIWASCVADNVGSVRVLTKVGMQQEGRLRQNEYYKGRYWDTLLFGLLIDEWRNRPDSPPVI